MCICCTDAQGVLAKITNVFYKLKINIKSINTINLEDENKILVEILSTRTYINKVINDLMILNVVNDVSIIDECNSIKKSIAIYKIQTDLFINNSERATELIKSYHAEIIDIQEDHTIIQLAANDNKILDMYNSLRPYGINKYVKSGNVIMNLN
jgi:acetolactate synthase small subunit